MAKRGAALSVFAVLFVLLALSDFMKPFDASMAFIFLGSRTDGAVQAILAWLFGLYLLAYAFGIWQMRRWALPMAYAYAGWVVLNMILFGARNRLTPLVINVLAMVIGIGVSSTAATLLGRRKAQLT